MNRLALALTSGLLFACGGGSRPAEGTGGSPASGGTGGQSMGGSQTGGSASGGALSGGASSGGASSAGAPNGGTTTVGSGGAATGGSSSGGSAGAPAAGGATPGTGGSGGSTAGSAGAPASGGAGGGGVLSSPSCPYTPPKDPATFPKGWTKGDVTVFNKNGGWTWYNDERVVVDTEAGKIVVSTAASNATNQGASPQIHAVIHDLATGSNSQTTMGSLSYSDDHNNGGIVITGPGKYFVGWAHHNVDCLSHWRTYDGTWAAEKTFQWNTQGCPWGSRPDNITYNNPWKMSAEGKYYNFVRSVQTSPNLLVSTDSGVTWKYAGRLTASPQQGYNAGYYKYWGNGVDRVDFFATEAHPRDANTSIYHGYLKGGKTYDSVGTQKDADVSDGMAPEITQFTKVFSAGSMINGITLRCLWNFDIARYDDGTIGVLWQGRESTCGDKNDTNAKHRILYSRFDGTKWTSTYLVRGGRTLYRNRSDWWEEDYLGGAALHPDDPGVIYVSTPVDPRDDTTVYPVHEIWKGVTCDNGATFKWEPITMNSENENLRPAVPKWDAKNSVVAWFRGNYQTAQMFSAETVGIITRTP